MLLPDLIKEHLDKETKLGKLMSPFMLKGKMIIALGKDNFEFYHKGSLVTVYEDETFEGHTVKPGKGIKNLLKQIGL